MRTNWEKAWMIAAALTVLLVVRLAEAYPPLARIHPAILGVSTGVALLLARTPAAGWRAFTRDPQLRLTLCYVLTIIAAVPLGLWRGGSLPVLISLPYLLVQMSALLLVAPRRADLDRLIDWVVIGGGAFAFFTGAIARVKFDVVGGYRISTSGMYDPNDLAAMLGMLIQLGIGMAMRRRGKWRLMAIVSLGMMLWIFIKTGSRGGVVALAVATSVILLAQNVKRFFLLVVAIAITLPALWAFGPRTFRVRTMSLLTIEDDYTYTAQDGRIQIWKRGLRYFVQSPLIGAGPDNFAIRDGNGLVSQGLGGAWLTVHNTYIQAMVELGLFGILGLLAMLYRAARDAIPLYRPRKSAPNVLHRPEIASCLVSFMVSATFLSHAYTYLLFFGVGLCALARRVWQAEMMATGAWRPAPALRSSRVLGGGPSHVRARGAALPAHRP